MLLKAYEVVKPLLLSITGVKLVQWFNDQYTGTIHTAPAVFVEFPGRLPFETLAGNIQQSPFVVRIHVVSKVIMNADKGIDETKLREHFNIVESVFKELHGLRAFDVAAPERLLFNTLARTAYEHMQQMQGWMVTVQDFEAMIYDNDPDYEGNIVTGDLEILK